MDARTLLAEVEDAKMQEVQVAWRATSVAAAAAAAATSQLHGRRNVALRAGRAALGAAAPGAAARAAACPGRAEADGGRARSCENLQGRRIAAKRVRRALASAALQRGDRARRAARTAPQGPVRAFALPQPPQFTTVANYYNPRSQPAVCVNASRCSAPNSCTAAVPVPRLSKHRPSCGCVPERRLTDLSITVAEPPSGRRIHQRKENGRHICSLDEARDITA